MSSSSSDSSDEEKASTQQSSPLASPPLASPPASNKNDEEEEEETAEVGQEKSAEKDGSDGSDSSVSSKSPMEVDQEDKTTTNLELSDSDANQDSDADADQDTDTPKTGNQPVINQDLRDKLMLSDSDDDDAVAKGSNEDENERLARNFALSDSSGDEAAPEPEVIVDEIPSSRLELGDLGPVFVRLPNFLSIEPKPFDERTYDPEMDEDDLVDLEGRSRMKLKIENTIRWRNVRNPETGEVKKESNAKIVKWSDGTMSLYLGGEMFDIQDQNAMPNQHLFTRIGASLQAQSAFERKFTFRPHSTDTLTHRKMTMNMADKSNRVQKVKMVTDVGMNPEKARTENIKKEEEKLRALNRKQASQRRARERARETGLSAGFLEDDEWGDESENVGALKRAYSSGTRKTGYDDYSDDESGAEEERTKSLMRARVIASSSEDEGEGGAAGSSQATEPPRSKTRVIDDD